MAVGNQFQCVAAGCIHLQCSRISNLHGDVLTHSDTCTLSAAHDTATLAQCLLHTIQWHLHSVCCTRYSATCTLSTAHDTVTHAQCLLHTIQRHLHSVCCTRYSATCTLSTAHDTVTYAHCLLHTIKWHMYSVLHTIQWHLHSVLHTIQWHLHTVCCTRYSTNCTVYCTRYSATYTLSAAQDTVTIAQGTAHDTVPLGHCLLHTIQCHLHTLYGTRYTDLIHIFTRLLFNTTSSLSPSCDVTFKRGAERRNRISKLFSLAEDKVEWVKFCERARLQRINTCVQQQDTYHRATNCAGSHMTSCCFLRMCNLWLLTYTKNGGE